MFTRDDLDALATSIMQRMTTLTSPRYPQTEVVTAPAAVPAAAAAAAVQRASIDAPAAPPAHAVPPEPATPTTAMPRPSDEDLSNLSRWLYPLIKWRLKSDLREDRERAGLLTDNYRRW